MHRGTVKAPWAVRQLNRVSVHSPVTMALHLNRITVLGILKLREPDYYRVDGGLALQVSPSGSKSWLFRYRSGDRHREMGLSPLLSVDMASAREKVRECRTAISESKIRWMNAVVRPTRPPCVGRAR